MSESILSEMKRVSGWSVVLGILIILVGVIAIASPLITGVVAVSVLAWTAIFGGLAQIFFAFQAYSGKSAVLDAILGVVYLAAGIYLMSHPLAGLLTLTLMLGALLLGYGVIAAVMAFQMRPLTGWGWMLFDAAATALLGLMIMAHWPIDSAWVIGTMFGVSILFSGVTRLMISLGLRHFTSEVAHA